MISFATSIRKTRSEMAPRPKPEYNLQPSFSSTAIVILPVAAIYTAHNTL